MPRRAELSTPTTSTANLKALFEQAPALIAILMGPDGVVELFNPEFQKLWGHRDVLGKKMREAFPELEGQGWFEIVSEVLTTGKPTHGRARPARFRGREAFFDFVYQPYKNANGTTVGVMVFGIDVTTQIVAARTARQSEERYQAFIRHSSEGIWRVELDKPISVALPADEQIELMYRYAYMAEANDAMAVMYGVATADDLVGLRLTDLFVREDPRNTAYLHAFVAAGYSLSGVDSHEVDIHGNDKFFRNSLVGVIENGYVVRAWGTQQDVTEQHIAEQALRASETRLALALKASKMGIWEWNIKTGELTWSDELKELFGLQPADDITYEKYLSLLHPEDRERAQAVIQEAIRTGKEYRIEHRTIWPDGSEHWVLGQGKCFVSGGKPTRMLGTSMNIDDRKTAENELHATEAINIALKTQQAQLVELNNSKDEFISLASHQLRTPATGVKQYIGMLIEGYCGDLTPDQHDFLAVAYESNERQLHIIDDLLKVAHVDAGKVQLAKEPVNATRLVHDIVAEQSSLYARRKQRLTFAHAPVEVMAELDPARIRMVLENLIDNASKYSLPGKTVVVYLEDHADTVVVHIKDHGVGIARKDRSKLFHKFSRINNELSTLVGGTGLGLYWAKKIVDLHGGSIDVESRLHRGSDFIVILPKGVGHAEDTDRRR